MILRGSVYSKILEMDTGLAIAAPNGYAPGKPYKVAYLLHGIGGNAATWADYSMLPTYAGNGDTVYVMPEVARSFYVDMKFGFRYFSYVTEELPGVCRRVFNISAARERTVVMGASMGGYGALKCALSRPDLYGACGAFASACLFLREGMEYQRDPANLPALVARVGRKVVDDFVCAFGPDLEWSPAIDLLELAQKASSSGTMPNIYAACGDQDPFREDNAKFAEAMRKLGYRYTYDELRGGHDFTFFDAALKRAVDAFAL